MAQVSIQYALDHRLNHMEAMTIRNELNRLCGVNLVRVDAKEGLLCVDFNDQNLSMEDIEHDMTVLGHPVMMIDCIIF